MAVQVSARANSDTAEAEPAAGQVVYSDEVEQDDWVQDGRGFWTTKPFGGLSAQAGETFLALRNPNGFTVTSIQRDAVLQLQPGRYTLTVRVGAPRSEEGFVGVDRVAIGLFNPQAESSERDAARQLRSRIEQLRQAEGVTFQAVDQPEPAAGEWATWTYTYEVGPGSVLAGQRVGLGCFAVTDEGGGAVAFDQIRVEKATAAEPE